MNASPPKVSVCVLSYNHGPYLRDCLQSLVTQETDFPFEVIVSDDCSRDDSRAIVAEFAERWPDIVRAQYHSANIGGNKNYFSAHRAARGEYIAHMDGDDAALPGKLQRQADFLDANPDVNICWHRIEVFNRAGTVVAHPPPSFPWLGRRVDRAELMLLGPFGPHSATMYRRSCFSERYAEFPLAIDWLLSIEIMGEGSGVMLPEVLSRYRVHAAGTSGGATASRRTREYLCACQEELVGRFPRYRRLVAVRALVVAAMDFANRQPYFLLSLRVLLRCRAWPALSRMGRIFRFWRQSRLPDQFR